MSETPHFGFMAHVEFPLVQSLLVHGPASRIVFFFFLQHWRLIVSLKLWIRAVILRRSLVFYFYVDTFPFTYGTKMICFKNCMYRRSLPQRGYKLKLRKRLYINKKAVSRNQSEIKLQCLYEVICEHCFWDSLEKEITEWLHRRLWGKHEVQKCLFAGLTSGWGMLASLDSWW